MKVRALVGAGLVALVGAAVAPTAAAQDADSAATAVTFTLENGGALEIAVGDDQALAIGTVANDGTAVTGTLDPVTVDDSRNSTAGWIAYAYSSDFTMDDDDVDTDPDFTIPAENVTISATAADLATLRGEPSNDLKGVFVGSSTNGAAVHGADLPGGKIGEVTSTGLGGVLDALNLLLGGALGTANHSVQFTPSVSIAIPAGAGAGLYQGVITQTVA